jgi:hypothetical protein
MPDPLETVAPEKRIEAERLDAIYREVAGWQPRLWGKIIGYGRYRYRTQSGQEGEFLATGFNMRGRDIAIHILPGYSEFPEIAARLGPHKRGKSCWYIKTLDAIDEAALRDLIRAGLEDLAREAEVEAT